MPGQTPQALAPLFNAVGQALRQNQAALNAADAFNGNHGDHMAAIFERAAQAAEERAAATLPEALVYAAEQLERLTGNGSAPVYARGLRQLAAQFRQYQVSTADLLGYLQKAMKQADEAAAAELMQAEAGGQASAGDVLKALVSGLAAWSQSEAALAQGQQPGEAKLNMGALFEFGMAYMQAKQRGGSKAEVIAEAAASVSPLSQLPYRRESARLAVQAMLEAAGR
jgi:mevalonate kinase